MESFPWMFKKADLSGMVSELVTGKDQVQSNSELATGKGQVWSNSELATGKCVPNFSCPVSLLCVGN